MSRKNHPAPMLATITSKRLDEIREAIVYDVSRTHQWRSEKAAEYPTDDQNRRAMTLLVKLETTVRDISTDKLSRFERAWDADGYRHSVVWGEILLGVGFQSAPNAAEHLIDDLLAAMST